MNLSKYLKPAKNLLGAFALSVILGYGGVRASNSQYSTQYDPKTQIPPQIQSDSPSISLFGQTYLISDEPVMQDTKRKKETVGYHQNYRKVDNLRINRNNKEGTYMNGSEAKGILDIAKLSEEGVYEDAWVYSKRAKKWIEIGINEKLHNIWGRYSACDINKTSLEKIMSKEKDIIINHDHPDPNKIPYAEDSFRFLFSSLGESKANNQSLATPGNIDANLIPKGYQRYFLSVGDMKKCIELSLLHQKKYAGNSLKIEQTTLEGVMSVELTENGKRTYKRFKDSELEEMLTQKMENALRKIKNVQEERGVKLSKKKFMQAFCMLMSNYNMQLKFVPLEEIKKQAVSYS